MKIAIIGASNNREKYSNIILRDLTKKWYEVFPVNPMQDYIEWIKCYKNIWDLPKNIDVLNFVTPPNITFTLLQEAWDVWFKKIWCQPWASDENVKKYLEENNFEFIVDSCIMLKKI